jgi:hypothetical protein
MSIEEESDSYQIVDEDKKLSDLGIEPDGIPDDDSLLGDNLTLRMGELANFDTNSNHEEKNQTARIDSKYLMQPIEEEKSFDVGN